MADVTVLLLVRAAHVFRDLLPALASYALYRGDKRRSCQQQDVGIRPWRRTTLLRLPSGAFSCQQRRC